MNVRGHGVNRGDADDVRKRTSLTVLLKIELLSSITVAVLKEPSADP